MIQDLGGRSAVATPAVRTTAHNAAIPGGLPHPNLILRLVGTVGVSDTGGAVNTWADQSSYGNDATGSGTARPTTGTRTINGLNLIDFDGTNDVMTGTIADVPSHHDGSGESRLTVYFAGVVDAVASSVVWLDLNAGSDFIQWRTPFNVIRISSDATLDSSFSPFTNTVTFFMVAVFAGAGDPVSATIEVNGANVATGSTGRDVPWGSYSLGGSGGVFANMAIAELQVYDDLLDATTDAAIRAGYSSTWGVTT